MAASHLACNLMKMPGSSGVLTVAGDTKDALAALKLAFRAVGEVPEALGAEPVKALVNFLRANKEVFAWEPKDLAGVPMGVIEHHLNVCPNVCPMMQKARRQSIEK